MRVLIAGSGDLGGRIARRMRAAGDDVVSIVRRPRPNEPETLALDLTQPLVLPIAGEFDVLVHCLSPAHRDEASYRAVYVDALRRLLDACPDVPRVVFVSSTAVYGDHGGAWVDESASCHPSAFNGQVLLAAERFAQSCGREALVLRLGGLYGPGREMLLRRVRSGEPLPTAEPPLYTNRIHVDDAAAATVHLIAQGAAGLFNLVDGMPAAQPVVLDWLADRLGLPRLARTASGPPPENKRIANAKLRNAGFIFRYPDFRAGYEDLVR